MFSCCDSSSCCSCDCGVIECLLLVEAQVFFHLEINGGVGCFIVSGGIGSSGFFSDCNVNRDGSGSNLCGNVVAVQLVSVLAIFAVIDGCSGCNGL